MGAFRGDEIAVLPGVRDVLLHGDDGDRHMLLRSLLVATPPFLATISLCLHHMQVLKGAAASSRRRYYSWLTAFPAVVAASCWLQVALPKLALAALLAQEVWEAVSLHYFSEAMVCLMGGGEECVKVLAGEDPHGMFRSTNRWCVPPCCCLPALLPCAFRDGRAPFETRMLTKLRRMIEQYCYVVPVTATLTLVASLYPILIAPELEDDRGIRRDLSLLAQAVEAVQGVSLLVCLYGLFVLYKATKGALAEYDTTGKFVGIKSMIVLSLVQRIIIVNLVRHGVIGSGRGTLFTPEVMGTRLQAFLLGWELPLLQLVVNRAFPLSELVPASAMRYSSLSA